MIIIRVYGVYTLYSASIRLNTGIIPGIIEYSVDIHYIRVLLPDIPE